VFNGKRLFTARVVSIDADAEDGPLYLVHFLGWNQRHDQKVPVSHMNKMTADNLAYQGELEAAYVRDGGKGPSSVSEAEKKVETKEKKKRGRKAAAKTATPKKVRKAVPMESKETLMADVIASVDGSEAAKITDRQFEAKLRKAFYKFDEDNSNSIDRQELGKMLRSLGRRASSKKVDQLFAVLDENGDGSIEFLEFLRYFKMKDTEVDDGKYCSCQQPYDNRFMLACDSGLDGCLEWFHGDCVGVANEAEVAGVVWFCPACAAKYPRELARAENPLILDGHKYDRKMITAARIAQNERGEITLEDAQVIAGGILADSRYTAVEKATMKYIRAQFQFTPEADKYVRHAIASNASRKSAKARATSSSADAKQAEEAAPAEAEAAPAEAAPAETAPAEAAPAETAPTEAAPAEAAPVEEAPAEEVADVDMAEVSTEAAEDAEMSEVKTESEAKSEEKATKKRARADNSTRTVKRVKTEAKEKKAPSIRRTTSLLSREALAVMLESKTPQQSAFVNENNRKFTAQLRRVFRRVDEDGNGRLSRDELAAMMRSIGRRPLKRKIDAIFATLDVNDDGDIDFDEFVKYFSAKDTEEDTGKYCTCDEPSNGRLMVQCEAGFEGCKDWFHCECVDLSDESLPDVWFCASCTESNPDKIKMLSDTILVKSRRLDRKMVQCARAAVEDHGNITLEDAKTILADVLEDESYSKLEKKTMQYLRDEFKFTSEADDWLRTEIRSFASKQGALTRAINRQGEVKQTKKTKAAKAPTEAEVSTATQQLQYDPLSLTEQQIEAVRQYVIRWFTNHPLSAISRLAPTVAGLSLASLLMISRNDWKEALGGDPLSTTEIMTFMSGYNQQE
jgi:Ca2+-binding EF-hand superfamily protein